MIYEIEFLPSALKEWKKLGEGLRLQLKKKLAERQRSPRVQADAMAGMRDCYKIKLRSAGYRLIYEVRDRQLVILVIAVGKRERAEVFEIAKTRLANRNDRS